ncbi:MAG TPA: M20/M25/M40 family metallo-hydrolase [Blastocatellia bacterium]
MRLIEIWLAFFGVALASSAAQAQTGPADLSADQRLARDIFQQLIEINTTDSTGDVTAAARAMAERLKAAGFPDEDVKVLEPHPRKGNLVARLRGTGARKPILLLAHLDVVEAKREDWSFDPFKFLEKDGYYYGRGTSDDEEQRRPQLAAGEGQRDLSSRRRAATSD